MSLTTGSGPFGDRPAGRFSVPLPDALDYVEPFRRRVCGTAAGRTLVESETVLLVHRAGTAVVGDALVEDVAWSYEEPRPECRPIAGLLSFDDARATVVHDLPRAPHGF